MNLYQHAKNYNFSSFCFRDIIDLKIIQYDWPGEFWPISQEPDFSQIWNFCKNTENNINFCYRPNFKKWLNFPINSKKPIFWRIFGPFCPFLGQTYILSFFPPKNLALLGTTQHGPLKPWWVPKKKTILRKHLDRRTEGQKSRRTDRKTLIHKTLPVMAEGPIRGLAKTYKLLTILMEL